jgi:hypothetical protein
MHAVHRSQRGILQDVNLGIYIFRKLEYDESLQEV